jgi:peptidoglycan/LPS O-acetylase OafA/YrhL
MSDFAPTRLIGLDIVRGGAMTSVLFAHARFLMDVPNDFLFLSVTGKFGVELFFVLSGFLIGAILIRVCEREISFPSLFRFWVRRWLRTLPAYFAVLIFIWIVFNKINYLYFVFLQDLVIGNWDILPVSWTLVIEEWFYLLFPPICFVLLMLSARWGFLIAALMLLFSSLILSLGDYSACAADAKPLICFENDIRKFTFRFTSLGMGAMLAYTHHRWDLRETLRSRLSTLKIVTLIVNFLVLAFCANVILNYPGMLAPAWSFALFYPLMGIASVFLITLMFVWEPVPPRKVGIFFSFTSVTSYSCYLWHLMIVDQARIHLTSLNPYIAAFIFIVASIAVGGISYFLIEKPFLKIRDRMFK